MTTSCSSCKTCNIARAAFWGAIFGLLYFFADLLSALLALSYLADFTFAGLLLLAIAAAFCALLGGALGLVAYALWVLVLKRFVRVKINAKSVKIAAIAFGVIVIAGGYWGRFDRRPDALPPPSSAPPQNARSVLLVVVDALRADALYGADFSFPHTPKIHDLSPKAAIFTDAESTASWTIPSVATILTGILPERHYAHRGYLPDWTPTLAKRLRAAGYDTAAVVDNAILEKRNGYTAGFASYVQKSAYRFAFSLPAFKLLPKNLRALLQNEFKVFESGAIKTTRAAVEIIDQARQRPLFLYTHYMDPHDPYYAHDEIAYNLSNTLPANAARLAARVRADPRDVPSKPELDYLREHYLGEVKFIDTPLTQLVKSFTKRFGDDAIVIVTADHGEEFLEHGGLLHGMNLNRELVHVPLMIFGGPINQMPPEKRRIKTPVSLVDLTPTLLELANVSPEIGNEGFAMDGVSLIPLMREGDNLKSPRPLFASQTQYQRRIYRWREGDLALIITFRAGKQTRELFNVASDPTEHHDLSAQFPQIVGEMDMRMAKSNERQVKSRDPLPSKSKRDIESLRGLGYID